MNKFLHLAILAFVLSLEPRAPAQEPAKSEAMFRPGAEWPDADGQHINCHGGGVLFENGTYFWFGERRGRQPSSQGVAVYSSKDVYHWKNEGLALAPVDDTNSDIARGCVMERPKVLRNPKTGQYVMWFHLELGGRGYNAARAGVAVSEKVAGPYRFINSFRPNDNMSRDMTLFLDDDSRAYQIYSSRDNYDLRICRLSDDFPSPTTNDVLISSDHREAPAMFKYQGKYYLFTSGCTGWKPNAANYYMSEHILGPWTLHANPCRGPKAETTFDGQPAFVLPVPGKPGAFIFMADRWNPADLQNSRHLWLPVQFKDGEVIVEWKDEWDLGWFGGK